MCNPVAFAVAGAGQSLMGAMGTNSQIRAQNEANRQRFERTKEMAAGAFSTTMAQLGIQFAQKRQAAAQQLNKVSTQALEAASAYEVTGDVRGVIGGTSIMAIMQQPYTKLGQVEAAQGAQKEMDSAAYWGQGTIGQQKYVQRSLGGWTPDQAEQSGLAMLVGAGMAGASAFLGAKAAGIGETTRTAAGEPLSQNVKNFFNPGYRPGGVHALPSNLDLPPFSGWY